MSKRVLGIVAAGVALFATSSHAVTLDRSSKVTVTVGSNLSVDLYAKSDAPNEYYYIPSRVRVAGGTNNEPQLTILTYISDGSEGASGGTFNGLVTWGLTESEEREVRRKLGRMRSGARMQGAAVLDTVEEGPAVTVLVGLGGDEEVAWTGVAPLQAGGRAAIAANLSPRGAQLLDVGIAEGNVSGISVGMNFLVPFKADLGNCTVVIDWESINRSFDRVDFDSVRSSRGALWWRRETQTESLHLSGFSWALNEGYITNDCDYDRANPEQQEFFENAIAAFLTAKLSATQEAQQAAQQAEADEAAAEDDEDSDGASPQNPQNPGRDRYYYDYTKSLFSYQSGREEFSISRSITVREPIGIVGNVNEWVPDLDAAPDGVRIRSVNLTTSEFTQVPVNFTLGGRAIQMMTQGSSTTDIPPLNSVVVTTRKRRDSGEDFSRSHTFTKQKVDAGELDYTAEYARGTSTDPLNYEYAVTWNYVGRRGAEGAYVSSDAGSHTLEPDAQSAPILFRADPSALAENGVVGATAEVRYRFLGEDRTGYLNVFANDDPQDQAVLYVDNDTPNVAVRTVYTHQTHGQLATPWEAKSVPNSGSVVVFAIIPEEMRAQEPTFIDRAQDAVEGAAERKLDDVLEEFGRL